MWAQWSEKQVKLQQLLAWWLRQPQLTSLGLSYFILLYYRVMWGLINLYPKKLRTVVDTYRALHPNTVFSTPSDFLWQCRTPHVKDNNSSWNIDLVKCLYTWRWEMYNGRNLRYYKQFICYALFGLVIWLSLASFFKKIKKEKKKKGGRERNYSIWTKLQKLK